MSKMREDKATTTPIAAVPEDGILLADQHNWVVLPKEIKIKMKDWRRWVEADSEGDFETQMGFLAQYVTQWTFEGDPNDLDAWDELDLSEYVAINKAVSETIAEEIKRKNS